MITDIPVALIRGRIGARKLEEDTVKSLVESIKDVGIINPLTVRPKRIFSGGIEVDGWELIAGSHRYEAAKRLRFDTVPCTVSNDDDLHAELVMIDENLMRAELSPALRASQTSRRKEIYEVLHPETKRGVAGAISSNLLQGNATAESAVASFTEETAKATGKSVRTIRQDAERGKKVSPEVLRMIEGTPLDTGTYLDRLKDMPPNKQVEAAENDLKEKNEKPKQKRESRTNSKSGGKVVNLDESKLKIDQAEYLAERLIERFTSDELPSITEALRDTDTKYIVAAIKKRVDTPIMDRQFA